MTPRIQRLFLALIAAQATHSVEEYAFRLYDVFAPARWVSGALGIDRAAGFVVANTLLVTFGLWCHLTRVRTTHRRARFWAWFWTALEGANGSAHILLAVGEGGYFPGLATAPILLGLSAALATSLSRTAGPDPV